MTTMTYGRKEQLNLKQTDGAPCAVCQKNKHTLRNRKSRLNGQNMFVCETCHTNKHEPRWLVIITAQTDGIDSVQDYLVNHRYPGPEIPAVDLVK